MSRLTLLSKILILSFILVLLFGIYYLYSNVYYINDNHILFDKNNNVISSTDKKWYFKRDVKKVQIKNKVIIPIQFQIKSGTLLETKIIVEFKQNNFDSSEQIYEKIKYQLYNYFGKVSLEQLYSKRIQHKVFIFEIIKNKYNNVKNIQIEFINIKK